MEPAEQGRFAIPREQFVSTEVDVLGPRILRLLRQAERGEAAPAGAAEESEVVLLA